MASAKRTTVKEAKTTVVDVERVVLELSHDEAEFVADLVASISGAGDRRKLSTNIYSALRSAGFSYETSRYAVKDVCGSFSNTKDLTGSIWVR